VLCSVLGLINCFALLAAAPDERVPKPQCKPKANLSPADCREQMFLCAGQGMNYSPALGGHNKMFTNVFVQLSA
jgi:hypothetical protein